MVAPSGGPRDSIPPQLIWAQPADRATGFRADKLTLRFNEFVRLQNRNGIRLLPETLKKPAIREALNQIEFDFKGIELDSATTYVLYLGDAIVDFTEGNKLKDFKRVFSTGATIDTGWISGKVMDARTLNARAQARVGLFDWVRAGDSVVYHQKARYWTVTNDSGIFQLGFLPDRDFRLFAWVDDNKDGLYKAGEAFDFYDIPARPLRSAYDSSVMYALKLSVDLDEQARIIDYAEKWPGWLGITFSARPGVIQWNIEGSLKPDSIVPLQFWKGDTAFIYVGDAYTKAELGGVVGICKMAHRSDTLFRKIKAVAASQKLNEAAVVALPKVNSSAGAAPELCAGKSFLRFSSDWPLEGFNSDEFVWMDTSGDQEVYRGAFCQYAEGTLSIRVPQQLKAGQTYKLKIPRGALMGAGEQALDSVVQIFKVVSDSLLKNVNVIITNSQKKCPDFSAISGAGLTLELSDERGYKCGVFRFTDTERGQWDRGQSSPALLPGLYSITVYVDENNNKQYDPASWRLNRRAEYSRTAQWTLKPKESGAVQIDICDLIWK